jgi:pyridinium-3,5-biscarboxylic acid mononucleotide synthase
MDEATLRTLLDDLQAGRLSDDEVVARLRRLPFGDVGDALVDHHRLLRQGAPEAVYGPGKSPAHCVAIVGELLTHGRGPVIVTRVHPAQREALDDAHPGAMSVGATMAWRVPEPDPEAPSVLVVSAGTADAEVVDECITTLAAHGIAARRLVDVGVAGLHRLLAHLDDVLAADVVVVVAGMEGALASVVGGLTGAPVVAVPTSVGYGAGLDGVTALLAMHASCAAGVTVVGIDNGYGAACAVARITRMHTTAREDRPQRHEDRPS